MSQPLKDTYVKETCKLGKGNDCCRYLVCGTEGFLCAKHIRELQVQIDQRYYMKTMVARGDNCEGRK